jgi:hypothetical protein
MTLSQRLALGTLGLAIALGATALMLARAEPAVPRLGGSLAPLKPLGRTEIVGRIEPAQLGKGQIVAVADNGSDVLLLQNQAWLRVGPGGAGGPFGASARDGEGRIASGADIAVQDTTVYVLDRVTRSVMVYTIEGQWRKRLPVLPTASPLAFAPERVLVTADGGLIVSGLRGAGVGSPSRILLQRRSNDAFDSLAAVPSSMFNVVIPVAGSAGSLFAVESSTYNFVELASNGAQVRQFARPDAPRVPLPDAVRRSLARWAVRIPATGNRELIPKYLPAVFMITRRQTGSFVAAIASAVDSVLIEELDRDGVPLHTFTRQPLPIPVGLTDHGLVTIREDVDATTIERHRW